MEGGKLNPLVLVAVIVVIVIGLVFTISRPTDKVVLETDYDPGKELTEQPKEEETKDEPVVTVEPDKEEIAFDVVYKKDTLELPSWAPSGVNNPPWEDSIYLASSSDGEMFTDERFFVQHAGVPNLLVTNEGIVVAIFQYFSYETQEMFEKMAYTVSEDNGETWSPVKAFQLPSRYDRGSKPVDPTLVQLEDGRFRLYFTFHEPGTQFAAMYSCSSTTLDGVFEDEGVQLAVEAMLLDPAVVYFEGVWHHYTVNHGGPGSLHSTSTTGLDFELQDPIEFQHQFLGAGLVDNGKLRFYGSANGVFLAESTEGSSYTMVKEGVVDGADPGIVKLPDGSYLILYTKVTQGQ